MVSGQLHEPVALSHPPTSTRYPLKRRLCGPQRWSGGFEEKWGLGAGLEVLEKSRGLRDGRVVLEKNEASELVWRFRRKWGPQNWDSNPRSFRN